MKLHELDHVVKLYNYGSKMGYPKCCVSEFINRFDKNGLNPNRNLNGSGYVPCYKCNAKYSGKELISNIEKNRTHNIKFLDNLWMCEIDGKEYINPVENERIVQIHKRIKISHTC